MRLTFARHGKSEANTRHVISNRDVPLGLTSLGKRQAQSLAGQLHDVPISAIFSSPILRARETADILSAEFNIPVQVTEALREYDCGILEGQSDEASWRLHREIFDDWTLSRNWERKPEGGESFLDIRDRFLPFIESLTRSVSYTDNHLFLVGHGGLFLLMLPLVLVNVDHSFARSHGIGNTEYVIAESGQHGLVCRQWCDVKLT